MAKIDVLNEIRNVPPGDFQVSVSLLSADGATVIATKAAPVSVPGSTLPIDQDAPVVTIG